MSRRLNGDTREIFSYSALIPAALMIGHHFSISAFCCAARASGVCFSAGQGSCPNSTKRWRSAGSAKLSRTAESSLAMTLFGVPFGAHRPSAFVACWRIGCLGPSGLRHHGIGFDLTGPDLRERTCNLGERQIDVSGKQILHHRRGTAIGHELDARAGISLKVGPDHVGAAANPADADRCLAWIVLKPSNEVRQILRRQPRSSDQPHRTICNQRYWFEIIDDIELQ